MIKLVITSTVLRTFNALFDYPSRQIDGLGIMERQKTRPREVS